MITSGSGLMARASFSHSHFQSDAPENAPRRAEEAAGGQEVRTDQQGPYGTLVPLVPDMPPIGLVGPRFVIGLYRVSHLLVELGRVEFD